MKIKVVQYDPAKGKGFYQINGKTLQFRYPSFGDGKWFIGDGELKDGIFYPVQQSKLKKFFNIFRKGSK